MIYEWFEKLSNVIKAGLAQIRSLTDRFGLI